jgi:hypothetical protein
VLVQRAVFGVVMKCNEYKYVTIGYLLLVVITSSTSPLIARLYLIRVIRY